jgi:hypothetical protein
VPDEFDRDLFGEVLASCPRFVRGGATERLELLEHLLDLAVVMLEHLDHITLLVRHRCLLDVAGYLCAFRP